MDRSRLATINSVYSISHGAVSKQIYLTQHGLTARTPLAGIPAEDGSGTGGEGPTDGSFVRGAGANNRRDGSANAETGTEHKLTPQQAHDRAWEMIREKYILLRPEENP